MYCGVDQVDDNGDICSLVGSVDSGRCVNDCGAMTELNSVSGSDGEDNVEFSVD